MITKAPVENAARISPEAFAMLGVPTLAYVRPIEVDGVAAWGVFAANGQQIGAAADREVALAAARQNDFEPVNVH
ncbi:MAG TPA: DUF1150 family protein [Candidatus Sulfotelmatobacter sp.]|nr:DUF1150 family protein [Candidatus Sulfotelmatobacter sp.]